MPNAPSKPIRLALYDASLAAFKTTEVLSSGDRLTLDANQFQLKQNIRQASKVWEARGSDTVIANAAPANATARADGITAPFHAESVQINGTWYHLSAWNTANGTAVYSLNLSTGVYTEITDKGNATHATTYGGDSTGKTRFATATTDVIFMVVTLPRRVLAGTEVPPYDVLVIHNGEDCPLVWIPSLPSSFNGVATFTSTNLKAFVHAPLNPPQGALAFNQTATFSAFMQVAATTGTNTFNNSTAARYYVLETTAAPYASGSNYCIKFGNTVGAAAGDTARFFMPNSVQFWGEQLVFIVETNTNGAAAVNDLFINCLLEVSPDNVTYNTVYQQDSTDSALAAGPMILPLDGGNGRFMVVYPLRNVPLTTSARTFKHFRFTRKNSAPAAAGECFILGVMGCGTGGGFEGGTAFSIAYSDAFGQAETGRIEASARLQQLLADVGGPAVVKSGTSSTTGFRLVEFSAAGVMYDYLLRIVNSAAGTTINGGLTQTVTGVFQGIPQCVDIYFRTYGELLADAEPLYWHRINLYTPQLSGSDHQWILSFQSGGSATKTITINTEQYGYGAFKETLTDRNLRDPGVAAPSSFNVTMPIGAAAHSANNRAFIGQVKTPSGNKAYGDVYFSRRGFPFRFTSVQDSFGDGSPDEASGSRLVFTGETVSAFVSSAAGYGGSSKVFVLTDQSFNALGRSSPFAVSTNSGATELGTRDRISADGTQEPRSVAEWNGLIMWWNQAGVLVRFVDGSPQPVSYLKFDDIYSGVPSARRGKMSAQIQSFRYKCGYSVGTSGNTRVMIWNCLTGVLESIDTMAAGSAERLVRAFDSSQSGAGQRLLAYGNDGKVYGYEEGTGNVAVRFVTRELSASQLKLSAGDGFFVDTVEIACDTVAGGSCAAACVPDFGASYTYTLSLDAQSGSIQWIVETTADVPATSSRTVYLDVTATMAAGKKIREVSIEIVTGTAETRLAA